MKTAFSQSWYNLQQIDFFKLFVPPYHQDWSFIVKQIIQLMLEQKNASALLSALFQASGVMIPLQLYHDPQNEIHCHWLQSIKLGNAIAAHCMTEPTGGTDIFNMQTKAKKNGDSWVINGTKTYICNAPIADIGLLYTNLEDYEQSIPYNLGCFLLDMSLPGVRKDPPLKKIGLNNITMGSIHLDNVEISSLYMIGDVGFGQHIAFAATTFERLIIPIAFVGIMQNLYKRSKGDVRAEIYRQLYVCECILHSTLAKIDLAHWKRGYIKLGCLLKWHISEAFIEVAKLSQDETIYRDALSSWIYSGTNDVLKATVGQLL
jgi:alkylation response protein AidB-like acyl-CoA dehydrogenase